MSFRAVCYQGDAHSCWKIRIQQPFNELKKYGVELFSTPIFPSAPGVPGPNFEALVRQISRFDLVIVQRIVGYQEASLICAAAFQNSVPVCFETDDDYIHLETHNPVYWSTALGNPLLDKARKLQLEGNQEELNKIIPELEIIRQQGLEGYKRSLGLYDAITCTTEELAQTLRPHNRNVTVFENQMKNIFPERDLTIEESTEEGKMVTVDRLGMRSIPAFYYERDPKNKFAPVLKDGNPILHRVSRYGYSCTVSHRADFMTIHEGLMKVVEKWGDQMHMVYLGDPWFYRMQNLRSGLRSEENPEGDGRPNRRIHIQETDQDLYLLNLRNLDAGYCPLEPVVFNQSKSDLKAMEYAVWGACPILPRFCTYTRNFIEGKTAMFYSNNDEFFAVNDYLLSNPAAREHIGNNARQYIYEKRLEKDHVERRYHFYLDLINSKKKFKPLLPNKGK